MLFQEFEFQRTTMLGHVSQLMDRGNEVVRELENERTEGRRLMDELDAKDVRFAHQWPPSMMWTMPWSPPLSCDDTEEKVRPSVVSVSWKSEQLGIWYKASSTPIVYLDRMR